LSSSIGVPFDNKTIVLTDYTNYIPFLLIIVLSVLIFMAVGHPFVILKVVSSNPSVIDRHFK
jgi:hypothetical protein